MCHGCPWEDSTEAGCQKLERRGVLHGEGREPHTGAPPQGDTPPSAGSSGFLTGRGRGGPLRQHWGSAKRVRCPTCPGGSEGGSGRIGLFRGVAHVSQPTSEPTATAARHLFVDASGCLRSSYDSRRCSMWPRSPPECTRLKNTAPVAEKSLGVSGVALATAEGRGLSGRAGQVVGNPSGSVIVTRLQRASA